MSEVVESIMRGGDRGLSGRHQILKIEANETLKLNYFTDGWSSKLTVKFDRKKEATKITIDFSINTQDAPDSIEPLIESRNVFYFIQGSWNHAIFRLRSLLEDDHAGVVMPPQNNDHAVQLYIDIKSTPEKIFNALLSVEQIKAWSSLMGEGEIDPKVDGVYCYGWYPKNTPLKDLHDGPSKILKLGKNKLLVHNWHGGLEIAEISYSIENKGNGVTRLNFKHSPLLGFTHGNVWSYRSGWSESFYGLKWYLERSELNESWFKSE